MGARPYPPRDLYRAYVAQSDVFVGVYWQRYGWVAPSMVISGLEDEYVLSSCKPRLIYVKDANEREPRMTDLIDRIMNDGTASFRYGVEGHVQAGGHHGFAFSRSASRVRLPAARVRRRVA